MSHVPDTELFSAYLDGELTADEQVRVEQILATSPEARQLLEELRALDSTLQSLPQEKLDEDLSTRVLEIAERRMLLPDRPSDETTAGNRPSAGRAAEAMQGSEADSIGWLGIPWREISWRGMLSQRALIWSGVVVATAIIISFTSPPPPKANREIAKFNQQPSSAAPAVSGEERRKSSTSDGSWDVPAGQQRKLPTEDRLAESRKAAVGQDRSKNTDADNDHHDGETARASRRAEHDKLAMRKKDAEWPAPVAPADMPVAGLAANRTGDLKSQLAVGDGSEFRSKSAGKKSLGEAAREAPANDESGQTDARSLKEKDRRLAQKRAAAPIDTLADAKPAAMPLPASPAAPVASQPEPLAYAARQQLMNGTGFGATNNSLSTEAIAAGNQQVGQASANRFVRQAVPAAIRVRLDVSALAMQNNVFEDLLARNGLGSNQNSTNDDPRALKREGNFQALTATANSPRGSVAKTMPEQRNDQRSDAGGLRQQARKSMTYEFDVSPEQLAIIIKQIGERADSFSAPQLTENYGFAADSSFGNNFSGGIGGGRLTDRPGEQQQAKADAGENNLRGEEAAQPQAAVAAAPESAKQTAAPAVKVAKQHVVFVLNVVEHLTPASRRASQTAAPAASPPAKQ